MDPRNEYLTQMLEKIGAPLLGAITAVLGGKGGDNLQEEAQAMASLLGKTVQLSIDLANASELAKGGVQDDSLRVALAALAAPMVAAHYRKDGKIPADNDLKKTTAALQAVMSFSENFAPEAENTARLKNLRGEDVAIDAHQINVHYIHAFIPVINAVGAFSFGQPEQKLVMDIASKLVAKSANLSRNLYSTMDEEQKKFTDLVSLRALAEIYAAVHTGETQRISAMSEEEQAALPQAPGGGLALDTVWSAFDARLAMLEAIAENALPGGGKAGGSKAPTPAPEKPAEQAAPPVTPAPTQPAETQAPPKEEAPKAPSSGNPMSMFAKPKNGEQSEDNPPAAASQKETPTPTPAPTEAPESTSEPEEAPKQSGGNPMSFFKSPTKNDDED